MYCICIVQNPIIFSTSKHVQLGYNVIAASETESNTCMLKYIIASTLLLIGLEICLREIKLSFPHALPPPIHPYAAYFKLVLRQWLLFKGD